MAKPATPPSANDRFEATRQAMVDDQIIARGVSAPEVVAAMRKVPRHLFLDSTRGEAAYEDCPIPIGYGQTMSQPYMVARMTELLELSGTETVLEIGAGSGYQTAILCELARKVYAVEIVPQLAERARVRLAELGYRNVVLESFDGTAGWPEHAPFDAILVAAGAPRIPAMLCAQLAEPGRLVIPVGSHGEQQLLRIRRHHGKIETDVDTACRFVDLVGRYGWGGSIPEA